MNTLKDYVNYKLTHADKVAEAEGYPLTMQNCKKYKKVKDLKVYGDSFQEGTPTPDNPIEVQSVGELVTDTTDANYCMYKIPVVVKGKNLATAQQVCNTFNNYEEITVDGRESIRYNNNGRYTDFPYKENTQYTITFDYKVTQRSSAALDPSTEVLYFFYSDGTKGTAASRDAVHSTTMDVWQKGTITSKAGKTVVAIGLPGNFYKNWINIDVNTFQFEEGAIATEYEPYVETEIVNVFLNEPLRKLGDYADYIDFKENKVVRKIDKHLVVNESTAFWNTNIDKEDTVSIYREGWLGSAYPYLPNGQILSSFFPYYHWNGVGNNVDAVWSAGASAGFKINTNLIDGYDYTWSKTKKMQTFLQWAESIGLDWYLIRNKPLEEPLNIDLPKLKAKTSIIEVDTSFAPSNAYGKYIKK